MKNVKSFDSFNKLHEDKETPGIHNQLESVLNQYYLKRRNISDEEYDYYTSIDKKLENLNTSTITQLITILRSYYGNKNLDFQQQNAEANFEPIVGDEPVIKHFQDGNQEDQDPHGPTIKHFED